MRLGQWGHLGVYAVGKRSKSRYQLYDCEAPLTNEASYNTHLHHTLQLSIRKRSAKLILTQGREDHFNIHSSPTIMASEWDC